MSADSTSCKEDIKHYGCIFWTDVSISEIQDSAKPPGWNTTEKYVAFDTFVFVTAPQGHSIQADYSFNKGCQYTDL